MSARVPMRGTGAEQAVVAKKDRNGSGAKGLPHRAEAEATTVGGDVNGRIAEATAKPLPISKRQVWEAYKLVKAKGGAAGVDGQTLEEFEEDVGNNLYKLWNRLSFRQLHATGGQTCGNTKIRGRDSSARRPAHVGQNRADRDQAGRGADGGSAIS